MDRPLIGLGDAHRLRGDFWLAAHHFSRAAASDPSSFEALLGFGETLLQAGALEIAHQALAKAVGLRPRDPRALFALGSVALRKGLTELAIDAFRTAVEIEPRFSSARCNLGDALRERGDVDDAVECYRAALALEPDHVDALRGLANDRRDRGLVEEATELYLRALRNRPDSAATRCDYAALLKAQSTRGLRDEAIAQYAEAVRSTPHSVDAYVKLGCAHADAGSTESAEACFEAALGVDPTRVDARCLLAQIRLSSGRIDAAALLFLSAAKLNPASPDALWGAEHCARLSCDWKHFERASAAVERTTRAQLESGPTAIPSLSPHFSMLYPMSHRLRKELASRRASLSVNNVAKAGIVRNYAFSDELASRIRVGYVSSDFGDHPTTHLMRSVPGLHDRSKFEAFCYALSSDDGTAFRATLAAEAEHFVDLSGMSDVEAADRIYEDKIVVLVDLNGHTRGARSEIFALRPAPIRAMWLGYPGTSGAEYIDYFICDAIVCPPSLENLYSERLARLPGSCFIGDHARMFPHLLRRVFLTDGSDGEIGAPADGWPAIDALDLSQLHVADCDDAKIVERSVCTSGGPKTVSVLKLSTLDPIRELLAKNLVAAWLPNGILIKNGLVRDPDSSGGQSVPREILVTARSQYGLAENAVVYANFNQLYKLDPRTFDLWVEILAAVPNSILWLLKFPPCAEENLRVEAVRRGLSRDRLVFSDVAVKEEHVRRCQLADVCLDTHLCNGHTTSMDVLWAGTPVVTLPAETFASRVTASQLIALGCPELIARAPEEYRDIAVRMGTDRLYLRAIRAKVWKRRIDSGLFDCKRFVGGLETLYAKMWEKFENAEKPSHLNACESNDEGRRSTSTNSSVDR